MRLPAAAHNPQIKFIYSEKASNFCEISTIDLSYIVKFGYSEKATKFEKKT